jgi:hypothetical protein
MLLPVISAVAFMSVGGCASDEPKLIMGEERVMFTGTVETVEPLGHREASVYPIGVDPQFLLIVKVKSVEQNKRSPIASDQNASFAIHSPSRLLGTEDQIGREFRFKATWRFGPGKGFSWIEARAATTEGK